MKNVPPLFRRLLALFGLVVAFTFTASIISPGRSQARNTKSESAMVVGPAMGELVGATHRIRLVSSDPETRYTILNLDGEILAENLTADEVAQQFPSLPLLSEPLSEDPTGMIMADVEVEPSPSMGGPIY